MRIDAFLSQHPEAETLAALKSGAVEPRSLAPSVTEIISQQRNSQIQTLARAMVGQRLEGDFADVAVRGRLRRKHRTRELRDPRKASSLFLATCAQAGAVLRSLDLSGLDYPDHALGSLLVLISLTRTAPREREEHRSSWREVAVEAQRVERSASRGSTPLGAVLSPMLLEALSYDKVVALMVAELSGELVDETRRQDLERWTTRTVREGAARLKELSAGALERVEESQLMTSTEPEASYRPARESLRLSLAGERVAVDRFLDLVGDLGEVARIERETGPHLELTTVRVWSYVPLQRESLDRLARQARVVIAERD